MTVERMIELHLLLTLLPMVNQENLNIEKMSNRVSELMGDFMQPYVIDPAEKSE